MCTGPAKVPRCFPVKFAPLVASVSLSFFLLHKTALFQASCESQEQVYENSNACEERNEVRQ